MSPPLVRCFWAVRPPEESLDEVSQLVRLLKRPLSSLGLQVAWTPRESYHLTLKFLGDVDEGQLGAMVAQVQTQLVMRKVAGELRLGLIGLGVFPGPQRPHVLYVDACAGVDGGLPGTATDLQELQGQLEGWLAPLGYAREERPHNPHLTIGRVRGLTREDDLQAALPALLQVYAAHRHGPAFPVDALILYESQAAPSGPKYTPIARLPMAAAGSAP